MEVCFLSNQPHFPEHKEDSIDTIQFLEAARGLVWLVDQFGVLFDPVKKDLNQNIEKLHQKYEQNTLAHRCLLRMVLVEHRSGETHAITSLLWLRRGLKLMAEFLSGFLENEKQAVPHENLSTLLHKAYDNSLRPHHNFLVRCLFNVLCSSCPTRTNLMNILGHDRIQNDELFLSMLNKYLNNLESNLNTLLVFCKSNDIRPHH